jgi:hypothetical protein
MAQYPFYAAGNSSIIESQEQHLKNMRAWLFGVFTWLWYTAGTSDDQTKQSSGILLSGRFHSCVSWSSWKLIDNTERPFQSTAVSRSCVAAHWLAALRLWLGMPEGLGENWHTLSVPYIYQYILYIPVCRSYIGTKKQIQWQAMSSISW